MQQFDVLIVGGGIAGASLGAEIAGKARTAIIEAEAHCGMHSTGRSAAFWLESYGGPNVAVLSAASRDFLANPPADFSDHGFLRERGAVHLTQDLLPELPEGVESRAVEREELERLVPGIRPKWQRALLEPGCADIDVAGLHAAYLRKFRREGGTLANDARLETATFAEGLWTVRLSDGSAVHAAVLVNAAGAWADRVAEALRRAADRYRAEAADDGAAARRPIGTCATCPWSMTRPAHSISRAKATAASGSARTMRSTAIRATPRRRRSTSRPPSTDSSRWSTGRSRRWSEAGPGLRSFAPDRIPVYGFDPAVAVVLLVRGAGRLRHPDRARSEQAGCEPAAARGASGAARSNRHDGLSRPDGSPDY